MVIPGSSAVLISGIATALAGGFPLLGPLQNEPAWIFVSLLLFAATLALVPTVFLPRGRTFGAALEDATVRGDLTPSLRAAFADPVVARSHWEEASFPVRKRRARDRSNSARALRIPRRAECQPIGLPPAAKTLPAP